MSEAAIDSSRLDPVFEQAEREAAAFGHGYVGAVHLLLALTAEPDEKTRSALVRLGLDPLALRQRVLRSIGRGHDPAPAHPYPLTTRARNAVHRARAGAEAHNIAKVRPEDLLVGIGVEESIAGKVLRSLGVTTDTLHAVAYTP